MGGGNAQKTAMSRKKHLEKDAEGKNSGGGKAGVCLFQQTVFCLTINVFYLSYFDSP